MLEDGTLSGVSRQQLIASVTAATSTWNAVKRSAPELTLLPQAEARATDTAFARPCADELPPRPTRNLIILEDRVGGILTKTELGCTALWRRAAGTMLDRFVIFVRSSRIDIDTGADVPWTTEALQSVLTHELGHAIGLGHSQAPRGARVQMHAQYVPTMFPTNTLEQSTLEEDDQSSVAALYDSPNPAGLVQLRGRVILRQRERDVGGNSINVIAESVDEPNRKSYSFISGWVRGRGEFSLLVLPGDYILVTEELRHGLGKSPRSVLSEKTHLKVPTTLDSSRRLNLQLRIP